MFSIFRPFLFNLDPETAHDLAIKSLKFNFLPNQIFDVEDEEMLKVKILGKSFPNPIGLAAGFDKSAEVYDSLFKFGFGFIEVGTITPLKQLGNSKPRVFRLVEDFAMINRLGFNNDGIDVVKERIKSKQNRGILGINIGPNKNTKNQKNDFCLGLKNFFDKADYITINISSPNTQGLRNFHNEEKLDDLLKSLNKIKQEKKTKIPLVLKVSPDIEDSHISEISDIAIKNDISAIILTNTSNSNRDNLISEMKKEKGGLSGEPLQQISTNMIKKFYKQLKGKIPIIGVGGIYKYRRNGETHQYQGNLIHILQSAVTSNSYKAYKKYANEIYGLPIINLRDLLDFKKIRKPIDISEVESISNLRKRFGSGSMSHGALSTEAHETLAVAMNRIGAASCSGEGGEDPKRFIKKENGDSSNSKVKQIASARFGVTTEYLNNCSEIEIKISQGAKPGEGGQLPGFKVSNEIAKLRYSTPGVTLISPPPHHDIYSIEDLAQLIYDLKQVNPKARVGVKLVASSGIGTIAAGVAKAKADVILISGHSGGTGASPQTSVKFAGIPWEMGLTEVNQILTLNGLRHKITLRTDGGIKTGRDVVMAAMMGAEEFGIGTTSLVAMGCIMVRQCHSNTCPVGVCTQDEKLRKKFTGTPDKVVNLFTFIAEEVREILASLGFQNLKEIIGRTDLLKQVSRGTSNLDDLDLSPLLVQADPGKNKRYSNPELINKIPESLDEKIYDDIKNLIGKKNNIKRDYKIRNTNRAIGTRLSHYIYKKISKEKIGKNFITINLFGCAGQSLGAFGIKGLKLKVIGNANDYVGKSLSGAIIVITPPKESNLISHENTIIGNTVLYGATSGKLFAAGQSGERFAVRNSGAEAVIEGCDSNGCEYMTGGSVVVLGKVGDNFGAGMTGGMAFIYDPNQEFKNYVNPESVIWQAVETDFWKMYLKNLILEHLKETESKIAHKILDNFNDEVKKFQQVCPKEMLSKLSNPISFKSNISEAI